MNCRQCGHILNNNQTFCPNCGTKVEQGQVVNNNNMYEQQNNQFQGMNNQMYQQQNIFLEHKKREIYNYIYQCWNKRIQKNTKNSKRDKMQNRNIG